MLVGEGKITRVSEREGRWGDARGSSDGVLFLGRLDCAARSPAGGSFNLSVFFLLHIFLYLDSPPHLFFLFMFILFQPLSLLLHGFLASSSTAPFLPPSPGLVARCHFISLPSLLLLVCCLFSCHLYSYTCMDFPLACRWGLV
ncbi:hypothetical protein QBC39DRAFT_343330 [Podospora conica]|nr:hypothetical protein QBC39DRAFT_343330 [Schizothecium conicum]